jgi:Ca2+-binding RTX toxin-like protein
LSTYAGTAVSLDGGGGGSVLDFSSKTSLTVFNRVVSDSVDGFQTSNGSLVFHNIETIIGGSGNDTFALPSGVKLIDGGGGTNVLDVRSVAEKIDYYVATDSYQWSGGTFRIAHMNSVTPNAGQMIWHASNAADNIGNNTYFGEEHGEGGNDYFYRSTSPSYYFGDADNDTFEAYGRSWEHMDGGTGYDTVNFWAQVITAADLANFHNMEHLVFGNRYINISFSSSLGPNLQRIDTGWEADTISFSTIFAHMDVNSGDGDDTVYFGGSGNYDGGGNSTGGTYKDVFDFNALSNVTWDMGAQTVTAGSVAASYSHFETIRWSNNGGNDTIIGSGGRDVIAAGAGTNVVQAGGGDDQIVIEGGGTVVGGAGADEFYFRNNSQTSVVTITDFDVTSDTMTVYQYPNVTETYSATQDTHLYISGTLVAIFEGVHQMINISQHH